MGKQTVDVLIEGGKATAAPPLGPALGPLKVNIGAVVSAINDKTKDFKGMQVPVKVTVDEDTKEFEISIGTPPAAGLLKKEAGVKKGAGNPLAEKVADLKIQQVLKVAKMKEDSLLGKNDVMRVREILGTCQSMGILVEGKPANEILAEMKEGKFIDIIESGKTEVSAEELQKMEEERKALEAENKARHDEYMTKAKDILAKNGNKEKKTVRKMMTDAGIPMEVVNEVAPEEAEKK